MPHASELRTEFRVDLPPVAGRGVGPVSLHAVGAIVGLIDVVLIALTCLAVNVAYNLGDVGDIKPIIGIGMLAAVLFALLMNVRGLYSAHALGSLSQQLRGGLLCWAAVLLGLLTLLFLLKLSAGFSRGAMIIFGASWSLLFIAVRSVVAQQIAAARARGTFAGRRAILIGERSELAVPDVREVLERYGATDVDCFALPDDRAGDLAIANAAIRSAVNDRVELILLLLPWSEQDRIRLICEQLRALSLQVLLLPDRVVTSVLAEPGGVQARQLAIEVQRAPLSPSELLAKRTFDVAFAALSLLAMSVLMAVVALLIKLDSPGPVIFRQQRRGFNGRPFTIYKFRTMRVMEDGEHVHQAVRNDSRTTPLGRVLRMSSIDELPQLINVLRGDMSFVGPRPHAVAHDNEYSRIIENYAQRHHMKPGMTGWAQVNGLRGETNRDSMQRRVDLDLWYVNNWSLGLDLRIVARTFLEVIRHRNAW